MSERILDIDGVLNFRDLGGYLSSDGRSVRWGVLYRSAQLDRLSSRGVNELANLGIKTVVDLRFSDEIQLYPTMREAIPGAEMLSWHEELAEDTSQRSDLMKRSWRDSLASNDPKQVRDAMRLNYPQKLYTHRAIYRKLLQRLSEGHTPLLFHCAAGKDRTGVAAALILSLLGVSDELIVEDYMLTQKQLENRIESWLAGGAADNHDYEDFQQTFSKHSSEMLQPVLDTDQSYIQTLLDYVRTEYGGFAEYTRRVLELDEQVQVAMKSRLLDSTA